MVSDWIKWEGGECPVQGNTLVHVKFGDGYISTKGRAGKWLWDEAPVKEANIVAYKLASPRTLEEAYEDADKPMSDGYGDSALNVQHGGDHYAKLGDYQPWEVLRHWLTPEEFRGYMKGTAIAYLARERDKGGKLDIKKAAHTLQGLIELEEK